MCAPNNGCGRRTAVLTIRVSRYRRQARLAESRAAGYDIKRGKKPSVRSPTHYARSVSPYRLLAVHRYTRYFYTLGVAVGTTTLGSGIVNQSRRRVAYPNKQRDGDDTKRRTLRWCCLPSLPVRGVVRRKATNSFGNVKKKKLRPG